MSVFSFTSYKDFLTDYISRLPKGGRGEVNRMAASMGVHATLVSQVLRGDKDFSVEQIYKLAGYLGLIALERDYFILLLQTERAGAEDLKSYFQSKLDDLKNQSLNLATRFAKHRSLSDYERSVFYSSWIYSAVRLFTSVGKGQTLDACVEKFNLPRSELARILSFLKEAHLVSEDEGIYTMLSAHTHLEFGSPFLARHHSNWRIKAIQRSERLMTEELMFTSPFSISKKDFLRIREEFATLVKSTSAIIRDSPAEDIACLNIDLFWMTK